MASLWFRLRGHTSQHLAFLAVLSATAQGCGAGTASGTNAAAPGATTIAVAAATASAPTSPESAGVATTTTALDDAGGTQGSKLSDAHDSGEPSARAPSAPKGPHTHDPGRGPEDIRAIVVARRDETRACYDKARRSDPTVEGKLVLSWTIDPKGTVVETSVDASHSQINEPTVIGCVSDVIKKIRFAASPGGFETRTSYPFEFRPRATK